MRFIPARAGNSLRVPSTYGGKAVHPRACGELPLRRVVVMAPGGSSPRVRGTRLRFPRRYQSRRFIPARAGNSFAHEQGMAPQTVHPRACGELLVEMTMTLPPGGSSPRVRGTLIAPAGKSERDRFIPARAGNSARAPVRDGRHAVHPRACGELNCHATPDPIVNGSSPRVRGTPSPGVRGEQLRRFIPARAGNSPTACLATGGPAVHPRACGELFR